MNAVNYIKENLNKALIGELLSRYATGISDTGDGFRACCPIHGGDNPTSFVWNAHNGLWFCHSGDCGGGDVFDFVASIKNININTDFKRVVVETSNELNLDISNLELGERASRNVKETRMWIEYMLGKKVTENTPFDLFTLGTRQDINEYRNFSKDTISHFNSFYSSTYNRIVIPLYDRNREIIGVSMRRIEGDNSPKWIHLPKHLNTRLIIYNQETINDKKIRLVEGPFDVWNLWQIGIKNVGATLGSHLTKEQEDIILRNYTDVELIFDNDEAGIKATKKIINQLKLKVNLTIRTLGKLNDPGEIKDIEEFNKLSVLKPYRFLTLF